MTAASFEFAELDVDTALVLAELWPLAKVEVWPDGDGYNAIIRQSWTTHMLVRGTDPHDAIAKLGACIRAVNDPRLVSP